MQFLFLSFKMDKERVQLHLCNSVIVVFLIFNKAEVGRIKFNKKKKKEEEEPGGAGCSK